MRLAQNHKRVADLRFIMFARMGMTALILLASLAQSHAELSWIWYPEGDPHRQAVSFRTSFELSDVPKSALLQMSCDNQVTLFINDKKVAFSKRWEEPVKKDVTKFLKEGDNHIIAKCLNYGSIAGFVLNLEIVDEKEEARLIQTGSGWETTLVGKDEWGPVKVINQYGGAPWGKVFEPRPKEEPVAESEEGVFALPGFNVEQLYEVPKGEQGSWVGMTIDDKGRLITCDQYGGFYRVDVLGGRTEVERLDINLYGAHGVLYAFDSLYAYVNEGSDTHGLYRMKDTNGDEQYDEVTLILEMSAGGEHGVHSIILSPDGQSLYLVSGNNSDVPEVTHSRPVLGKWSEDHLLPRMADGRGHNRGRLAPGGFILKTDPETEHVELICTGFRNEFDAAFNLEGDLFAFDADMEYDVGSPWYRPTRVNHVVSGADFGWRNGSGKWPGYYPDSLPTTVDIGLGSPTGVSSGIGAKFPAKYQKAIFLNDWTYGTMYAIHLTAEGASYTGEKEEFISGRPLPLTDLLIHPTDGAMYFMVGGRRTQSALYRVTYIGKESTAPVSTGKLTNRAKKRRKLERLHEAGVGPEAIRKAWRSLGSDDRYLRHAARIAIEKQDPVKWAKKALAERDSRASIEALIALCRIGDPSLQPDILKSLGRLKLKRMDVDELLAAIRAWQLCFTRMGKPADAAAVIKKLSPLYPHENNFVNRELSQVLLYLGDRKATGQTVHLLLTAGDESIEYDDDAKLARNTRYARAAQKAHKSRPIVQQIALAFNLRTIKTGWSPELRKAYFSWFPRAGTWSGGHSFPIFIENIRREALANVTDAGEKLALDKLSQAEVKAPHYFTPPKGPGQLWTVDSAYSAVKGRLKPKSRDFESGKNLFRAAACISCHRFGNEGGGIGPDITGAGNRYSLKDLFENIIEPSKVISDQYGSIVVSKKDGTEIIGHLTAEENGKLYLMTNPYAPESSIEIDLSEIKSKKDYPVSSMPPGLINAMNADELADLAAYLLSGGNASDEVWLRK